jgi:hypothetical protein
MNWSTYLSVDGRTYLFAVTLVQPIRGWAHLAVCSDGVKVTSLTARGCMIAALSAKTAVLRKARKK